MFLNFVSKFEAICVHDLYYPNEFLFYRCNCPNGLKRPDGVCISVIQIAQSSAPKPPPPAAHHEDTWVVPDTKPDTTSKSHSSGEARRGFAGPIAICVLIFLSFSVLIITTAYNFRSRNRRLDEVRAILNSRSTSSLTVRDGRRASVGSLRDAPPSYHTLQPPSYEQATLDVGSLSSTSPSSVALLPRYGAPATWRVWRPPPSPFLLQGPVRRSRSMPLRWLLPPPRPLQARPSLNIVVSLILTTLNLRDVTKLTHFFCCSCSFPFLHTPCLL